MSRLQGDVSILLGVLCKPEWISTSHHSVSMFGCAGRKCECQEKWRSHWEMGLSCEPGVELAGKVASSACERVSEKETERVGEVSV